jgi:glycosyltransferase involved in cell wall biosynthesis
LSQFSKRELMELLAVPADKIHIIRPGVTGPNPRPLTPEPWPPASNIQPRVLYVGSIFNRRHVPDLIRAFAQVARMNPDVRLDLVGDDRSYPREDIVATIAREHIDDRIRWHQYVSDTELSSLYSAATAFAFLSEYEGLGLTPLEALAAGVPSVLLDTPVARESCGQAALYVARGDVTATARALEQLLFDDSVRRTLLAGAPPVLAQYNWDRAARATLDVLERSAS